MPHLTTKLIFVGLGGPDVSQAEAVIQMSSGYECWNLKKFTLDAFISALKAKIPPINENVLNNYRAADDNPNPDHGVKTREYEQCSWGLLLPEPVSGSLGGYGETLFLLNLYSPHFLHPLFYATDFGIWRQRQPQERLIYFHDQNQVQRFSRQSFVHFHSGLAPQSAFSVWQANRVANWTEEDWRLFVASMLYSEQWQYENSKKVFEWQRESADLATILEALFTAESGETTEIGYRLRKRIAVLACCTCPKYRR